MNVNDIVPYIIPWYKSIVVSAGVVFFRIIYQKYIQVAIQNYVDESPNKYDDYIFEAFKMPVEIVLYVAAIHAAVLYAPVELVDRLETPLRLLYSTIVACFFWGLYRLAGPLKIKDSEALLSQNDEDDITREGFLYHFFRDASFIKSRGLGDNKAVIDMISSIARICIIFLGFGGVAKELGFDLGAFVTSLSIGSAALVFAAKDIIANVFGSLVIIIDKPFQEGDWIKANSIEGRVEKITFRSTCVRTLGNELVYIPSSLLYNEPIVNISESKKRLITVDLDFDINTAPEAVESFIARTRKYLEENESLCHCAKSDVGVHFVKYDADACRVEITCFIQGFSRELYLEVQDKVNLDVLNIVKEMGLQLKAKD